jgi:hypothetical protein
MKFSYLGSTETMLPGRPGGTYFMSSLLQGTNDDKQGKPPVGAGLAVIPGSVQRLRSKQKTSNVFLEIGVCGVWNWGFLTDHAQVLLCIARAALTWPGSPGS